MLIRRGVDADPGATRPCPSDGMLPLGQHPIVHASRPPLFLFSWGGGSPQRLSIPSVPVFSLASYWFNQDSCPRILIAPQQVKPASSSTTPSRPRRLSHALTCLEPTVCILRALSNGHLLKNIFCPPLHYWTLSLLEILFSRRFFCKWKVMNQQDVLRSGLGWLNCLEVITSNPSQSADLFSKSSLFPGPQATWTRCVRLAASISPPPYMKSMEGVPHGPVPCTPQLGQVSLVSCRFVWVRAASGFRPNTCFRRIAYNGFFGNSCISIG